jgi:hypothetical protein
MFLITIEGEMHITQEVEQRFLVLLSLVDLGNYGTKGDVLDNIWNKGYINLNQNDLEIMESRSELRWRNNLAYTRKHLVTEKYMLDREINKWEISIKGRGYFSELCDAISSARFISYKYLTKKSIQRAKEILIG